MGGEGPRLALLNDQDAALPVPPVAPQTSVPSAAASLRGHASDFNVGMGDSCGIAKEKVAKDLRDLDMDLGMVARGGQLTVVRGDAAAHTHFAGPST